MAESDAAAAASATVVTVTDADVPAGAAGAAGARSSAAESGSGAQQDKSAQQVLVEQNGQFVLIAVEEARGRDEAGPPAAGSVEGEDEDEDEGEGEDEDEDEDGDGVESDHGEDSEDSEEEEQRLPGPQRPLRPHSARLKTAQPHGRRPHTASDGSVAEGREILLARWNVGLQVI